MNVALFHRSNGSKWPCKRFTGIEIYKVFADEEYMEQIKRTPPAKLKENLLTNGSGNFTETDFDGDQLIVTSQNLDSVMKMLAKRFKFNFFTNVAEEL